MLTSYNMYEDSQSVVDKNVRHEFSDFLAKVGLHHFMELGERTDLLMISTQDPLDNSAISRDENSMGMGERSVVDPLDNTGTSASDSMGLEKPMHLELLEENTLTSSEKPVNEDLGEFTSHPEDNTHVLHSLGNNCKCDTLNEVKETNVESLPKIKQKRIRPRKRRKNGTLLKDQAKKKKIEKQSLTCQICKLQKESLKELNRHFNDHVRKSDNKFECSSCGEAITTYDKFIEHLKNHENNKEKKSVKCFQCETCNKPFRFRCLLKDHKNLHTGHRPYLCSKCGKAFSLKASLKQHSRIHENKKHKCIYCDFSVFVKADLIKHIRTHTGERPYICEICGEGYIQSSHLVVHKRSHSGERPYKCDLCNRGFTKKGDVIRHRRIHTGELPYLCQVCGKAFRQSTQCSNHVKHHHPGTVDGKINIPGYIPNEHGCAINKGLLV